MHRKYPPIMAGTCFEPHLVPSLREDLPGVPAVQKAFRAYSAFVLAAQMGLHMFQWEHNGHRSTVSSTAEFIADVRRRVIEPHIKPHILAAGEPLASKLMEFLEQILAHLQFQQEMINSTGRPEYASLYCDVSEEAWSRVNRFVWQKVCDANDWVSQYIVRLGAKAASS